MKRLLSLSLVMFALMACNQPGPAGTGEKPSAGKAAVEGDYLARVGDSVITEAQMEKELSMLPPEVQQIFEAPGGRERLLGELVKKEMLYLEALKKDYPKTALYKERLAAMEKRLSIEMLLEQEIEDKTKATDEDAKAFYDENIDNFMIDVPGKKGEKETIPFESVKDLLKQRLVQEKQKELFDSFVASLKDKYNVELNDAAIKAAFGNVPEAPEAPVK